MEMSSGYRTTDLGVLPQEWTVDQLGSLHPFVTSGSRGWADYYADRGSAFIRITNLSRESIYLDLTDLKRVNLPPEDREGIRTQLQAGDLLISITADIGIIGYVDTRVPQPAYINQHIALVRVGPSEADTRFLAYFLASEHAQRAFRAATDQGAKAGMNLAGVCRIQAAFPPLPEQKAIAAALSDMDALLGALDRLIAKKRDLKQAAMQQLLTGQTRLPGFSGKWETKRLAEVVGEPLLNGVFNAPGKKGRGCRLINVGDLYAPPPVDTSTLELYDASKDDLRRFAVRDGDIFFTRSSLTPDGIAHCNVYQSSGKEPVVFDCHIIRARANPGLVNPLFLFRYCVSAEARRYLVANAKTTTMTTIDQGVLKNLPIATPPLPEQDAIAEVLSDIDAELVALEQRRDKTRLLKQGMMQELLTGRTRLV